jgi:hypothetical protein
LSAEVQMQAKSVEKPQKRVTTEAQESDIDSSIRTLQEESHQMVELIEIERTYSTETVLQFKRIIYALGISYNVKDAWNARDNIEKAFLTPQGVVCVIYTNGSVQSKPLEEIKSETLLKILSIAIPEAKKYLVEKRQITGMRASVLERVAKELGKVSSESEEKA